MHELAITESLVDCVRENTGQARVVRVVLEIGRLAGVVPDAIRSCFDVCASETTLEGASLEIVNVDGRARCRACRAEIDVADMMVMCRCGSVDLELVCGHELRIREVEVI